MIELKNINKNYKTKKGVTTNALTNITFDLPNNGMVFVVGKSGSGKSTLLNLLSLLDKPTDGELIINGKNTTIFKEKDYDSYRNTYMGFVFQDFNLIEKYNVYNNLELSISLQGKKITKETINETLKSVGLDGYGNRYINELSGGEKQRIAIARALIKNPNIILSDEPTGNLDTQNSEIIFQLLKDISQTKLVIVVTHDIEFAKKYADRIIELSDGKIISDNIINQKETNQLEIELKKSKLPFSKLLSLSWMSLKNKKIRLIITSFIITICLSLFGFSFLLTKFDINLSHAQAMVNNDNATITINKKIIGKNFTNISPALTMTNHDIKEITTKINNNNVKKINKMVINNEYVSLQYANEPRVTEYDIDSVYYNYYIEPEYFIEYSESELKKLNIIGDIPSNNEILINKIYADYILYKGLRILSTDNKGKVIEKDFFPASYEEIINSKAKIVLYQYDLGEETPYAIISGIIDEDLSKYESLKQKKSAAMRSNPVKEYNEFSAVQKPKLQEVVVSNTFFDSITLKQNNVVDASLYQTVYNYDNKDSYPEYDSYLSTITDEITVYNGKKDIKISSLNDNEIVLDITAIKIMTGINFYDEWNKYAADIKAEYDKKVKQREKLVEEQEEKMNNDPNYVYEEIPAIKEIDYEKLAKEYMKTYINEYGIIGKTLDIDINDLYERINDTKTETLSNLKVVGYNCAGMYSYLSNNLIDKYMREKTEVFNISFNENDINNIIKILEDYPSNSKFIATTDYTSTIKNVNSTIKSISKIAYPTTIGFLIFTIIIFTNYIISSINSSKKEIGILRSLGTKKSDIFKIYYTEGFIIGILGLVLSSIIIYVSCIVSNNIISKELFYDIRPIIFKYEVLLWILLSIVCIISISSIMPLVKISKNKPIDIIKEV